MLLCFSGSILANFLLGESPIKDFLHYQHLLLATVCWYLIFYSPLDLFDRFIRFLPIRLLVGVAKEIQRTKKIYTGVHSTLAVYPDGYIIVVLIGAIKGKKSQRKQTREKKPMRLSRLWRINHVIDGSIYSWSMVTKST